MITVYASPWSSPSPTQHSLPGGRYPLPGPDFHRLDRASFAWRTATPSSQWTFTTYSLPVSRRTHSRCGLHTRTVTVCRDRLSEGFRTLRLLHVCSGRFRLERVAGWGLHPLESAALSRRTWTAAIGIESQIHISRHERTLGRHGRSGAFVCGRGVHAVRRDRLRRKRGFES